MSSTIARRTVQFGPGRSTPTRESLRCTGRERSLLARVGIPCSGTQGIRPDNGGNLPRNAGRSVRNLPKIARIPCRVPAYREFPPPRPVRSRLQRAPPSRKYLRFQDNFRNDGIVPAIPGLCHGLSTSAWPETFLAALISKNLPFVSDPRKSGFADAWDASKEGR